MKNNLFAWAASTLFLVCSCSNEPVKEYAIIPHPAEIQYGKGSFQMDKPVTISGEAALTEEVEKLQQILADDYSIKARTSNDQAGNIKLLLDKTILPDQPEGYKLEVTPKQITIRANLPAGISHGIQSLRQMVTATNGAYQIQAGIIIDYPTFPWRAFMLDEGRYFKGKEVVFRLLDQMALLKMNTFHWHLTEDQGWRIEIKKYPKLTEIGSCRDSSEINHFHSNIFDGKPHCGYYTQEEIKEVIAYAAKHHINIVPEIEMPGHASAAIAAYPWLGTTGKQIRVQPAFGVHYDIYNVADPRVLQFQEDVLDEVRALFPGTVIHIGGDEIRYQQWKDSRQIQAYMKKHNIQTPAELQVFFTNNISNMLAEKGRRMMGWNDITGDILHEYQDDTDSAHSSGQQLNPSAIVQFWKGDPKLINQTLEKGYDIVNSYHEYTYLDYSYDDIPLEKAYLFNPVPEGLTPGREKQVLGLGCQMWCEFIPDETSMQEKVYPRIAAYAETGWTATSEKSYNRFMESLKPLLERWDKAGIQYGPVK